MTYIIAEAGQNHNGSMAMAHELVAMAADPRRADMASPLHYPCDAIKFTKRDLAHELTPAEMARPYRGANSFGRTYGEHRAALELDDHQHHDLYRHAKEAGLDFVETLCHPECLSLLDLFTPDRIKVASRDLRNPPLLEALAETQIPLIISTGMLTMSRDLDVSLDIITKHHDRVSILHCLSQYPADYRHLNLRTITWMRKRYGDRFTIGYSDHSIGIKYPLMAVALGAEIIEKHITLNRQLKGSDQAGSLERDGLYRMVRDIREGAIALGEEGIFGKEAMLDARKKLERSWAARRDIAKGEIITPADLHMLSPGTGYQGHHLKYIVGRPAVKDIPKDTLIDLFHLTEWPKAS